MSVHTETIRLELLDEHLKVLTEISGYDSERAVIRDALEALVDTNPELRLEMAIKLWKQGVISLGRAVEIAQSDRETFKNELAARGLSIVVDSDIEEILKVEERIQNLRRSQ